MGITVELDIFSGRPNPRWHLSPSQVAEFERKLSSLPPVSVSSLPHPPGLGYRGFIVRYLDSQNLEEPISIYQGIIQRGKLALTDSERNLEKWLLTTGGEAVEPNLQEYLSGELSG
jgi:hypothetical protein